jgi:hypothetical protein
MATCEVSGYGCEAPANLVYGDQPARILTCYRCGLPVCRECSTLSPDPMRQGRRTRRCDNCREAEGDFAAMYSERGNDGPA